MYFLLKEYDEKPLFPAPLNIIGYIWRIFGKECFKSCWICLCDSDCNILVFVASFDYPLFAEILDKAVTDLRKATDKEKEFIAIFERSCRNAVVNSEREAEKKKEDQKNGSQNDKSTNEAPEA